MKRELAFASEARSQFRSFTGRTRSSDTPSAQFTDSNRKSKVRPFVDRSAKSIDEVHVNRRSKRVKTMIPDGDSINAVKSKGDEESAVVGVQKGEDEAEKVEVVNGDDKSMAVVVCSGGDGSAAVVEVAKSEENGRGLAKKVSVKGKRSKNQVISITPKRFTRSALKDNPPAQFTDSNRKSEEQSLVDRSAKSIDEVHVNRRNRNRKDNPAARFTDSNRNSKEQSFDDHSAKPINEVLVNRRNRNMNRKDNPAARFTDSNRNSKEQSFVDHSAKPVDEGHVNRRNKRVKTMVPDGDSEVHKGEDEAEVVNGDDKPTAAEVFNGGDGSAAAVEVAKKIGLSKMPTNLKELLKTGLLEGFHVYYNLEIEGKKLGGQIKGVGILCSCNLCQGTKVISPSQFELHACKSYRHAIKHIYLENGKSLLELIEICQAAASETLNVAFKTVISSLPSKGRSICRNCNSSIDSSTENLLICDSCLNEIQVDAEPMVGSRRSIRKPKLLRASSPEPKASESSSLPIPSNKKSKPRRKRKLSELIQKTVKSAGNHKLKGDKIKSRTVKRSSRSSKSVTKRNMQLHSSIFEKGGLPDGTELTYIVQGKKLLDGYKRGNGIFCSCCKTEISASQFENHAGCAARKKPYEKIYIKNGLSLHEYALSMKMKGVGSTEG